MPGVSTDREYVHLGWRQNHSDVSILPFPRLAEIRREPTTFAGGLGDVGVAARRRHHRDGRLDLSGRRIKNSTSIFRNRELASPQEADVMHVTD
jgi:hypothetical protein